MNRIIVTGGAGFVGSNLTLQLQRDNPDARMIVIDDMRTGSFENLVGHDEPFRGTVIARPLKEIDLANLANQFQPDVIFHLASITDTTVDDEAAMIADNVEPFETLINIARAADIKLVWASSAATYGTDANGATTQRRPFTLDDAGNPANVYGFSKWVMENLHRQALEENAEFHIVGLRYFNVFGPGEGNKGQMASMVYQLADQILSGHRPRIFFDGTQARDQVYVKDVVAMTIAGAADHAKPGIYNVGSGVATSFNQIIEHLNTALGTEHEPEYFENPYGFYQDYTCADLSQTKAGLNIEPQYDAEQAIIQYAQWLRETREGGPKPEGMLHLEQTGD